MRKNFHKVRQFEDALVQSGEPAAARPVRVVFLRWEWLTTQCQFFSRHLVPGDSTEFEVGMIFIVSYSL